MTTYSNPNFESLTATEWLLTNSLGGFASSTVCGANTRRYHGLLVAAFDPPTQRKVMVSKVEETIATSRDCVVSIASNQYPGAIHPQGYQHLQSFERKPLPVAEFSVFGSSLRKTVFMPQGSNTTVLEYENTGSMAFQLRMNPLLVFRDYHSLMRESHEFDFWHEQTGNALRIHARFGAPALYLGFSKGVFKPCGSWLKNFQYTEEQARGLDFAEDCRSIGAIEAYLKPGERCYLVFTLEPEMLKQEPVALKSAEIKRLAGLSPKTADAFFNDLAVTADQFLVHRNSTNSPSIIAGYPWFTDWGRDTMIALRGLCIALGKQEEAKGIIRTFLRYLDGGMLPNRFPDQGESPEYNTIDATLWLFPVLYAYWKKFEDQSFIDEVFPKLSEIIESHLVGTRYNIHVTPEGLLFGGEGLSQLTWMDARIGDHVVTPRQGCAVEVNALWYNALMAYCFFAKTRSKKALQKTVLAGVDLEELAAKARKSFRKYFFNEKWHLNDVVIPGQYADASIRPNQIYAVSLPFSLLLPAEEKMVVANVKNHLLTPYGLRTLSPEHPDFKPVYAGDQWARDIAYHQGTVWPFLLGEYWLALIKTNSNAIITQREIRQEMAALEQHFYKKGCLFGISEIFDGMAPEQGKGCFQQAWSVGMMLQVLAELQEKQKQLPLKLKRQSHENNVSLA